MIYLAKIIYVLYRIFLIIKNLKRLKTFSLLCDLEFIVISYRLSRKTLLGACDSAALSCPATTVASKTWRELGKLPSAYIHENLISPDDSNIFSHTIAKCITGFNVTWFATFGG